MVCATLSDRCLSCLSVSDVGVLWPNGWMDQNATWYGGRHRPWPHCVRWGPSSPPQKGGTAAPQLSAHVYSGQTAGWIKMPPGTKLGLGPATLVLDGGPAPSLKRGHSSSHFSAMSIVAKRSPISATTEPLLFIRPNRSTMYVDTAHRYRPSSVVCLSVCLLRS